MHAETAVDGCHGNVLVEALRQRPAHLDLRPLHRIGIGQEAAVEVVENVAHRRPAAVVGMRSQK
jgi:hypothetical protein